MLWSTHTGEQHNLTKYWTWVIYSISNCAVLAEDNVQVYQVLFAADDEGGGMYSDCLY